MIKDEVTYYDLIKRNGYSENIKIINESEALTFEVSNFDEKNLFEIVRWLEQLQTNRPSKITVSDPVNFNKITFDHEIDLINITFKDYVYFINCNFQQKVFFSNCKFLERAHFVSCYFDDVVFFMDSFFFESVGFRSTEFAELVSFEKTVFYKDQLFDFTTFSNVALFSKAIFKQQVQFLDTKVGSDSFVSFEGAEFQQALDISRSNFWCRLNFWNAVINPHPSELSLYITDKLGKEVPKENKTVAFKRIRESFRIIKQNFRAEGNHIDAIEHHKNEMITYEKELKENKKLENQVLLILNKWSNNFGTSWINGVIFTVIVALIFYLVFLLSIYEELNFSLTWSAFGKTAKHYTQFLNITEWNYSPFGVNNYYWGYLILFIGRIFIGYGYYQTISAFRKYGKN